MKSDRAHGTLVFLELLLTTQALLSYMDDTKSIMLPLDGSDIVVLNVSGTFFHTRRSTLTHGFGANSYFSKLLDGPFAQQNLKDGSIFVDRSPAKFEIILEYLRTGLLEYPTSVNVISRISLLEEAKFFQLLPLVEFLTNTPPPTKSIERPLTNGVYGFYPIQRGDVRFIALIFLDDKRVLVSNAALPGAYARDNHLLQMRVAAKKANNGANEAASVMQFLHMYTMNGYNVEITGVNDVVVVMSVMMLDKTTLVGSRADNERGDLIILEHHDWKDKPSLNNKF